MEERVAVRPDGITVVRLAGRLDMGSADLLKRRVASLVEDGHARVAVDLTEVSFIDSAGLGALISGLKSTRSAGGDLRIAAPNEQTRMVLSLTGMERVLPEHPDADSAFD
jgi:anti-sigma B factor antagonist